MRNALTEERKEALLDNADKLHSGGSLIPPRLKSSRLDVWWLLASIGAALAFALWAVMYA